MQTEEFEELKRALAEAQALSLMTEEHLRDPEYRTTLRIAMLCVVGSGMCCAALSLSGGECRRDLPEGWVVFAVGEKRSNCSIMKKR
jgi:hypothetical protein